MKIIVAGTRTFNDYNLLTVKLNRYLYNVDDPIIVSGTARGADWLGEKYAKENGYQIRRFPADWDTHGKKAGYLRNAEMAKYADALVAFWDEKSKGTKHMLHLASHYGLEIRVVYYNRK